MVKDLVVEAEENQFEYVDYIGIYYQISSLLSELNEKNH